MATGELTEAQFTEQTKQIPISDGKCKYMNVAHKKVNARMYDYHCDIKLKVEKETFRAHRDVLAEASDYFSAMFRHNMVEKEKDAIELKDISPLGFRCMMDYFYHGHITVESDNVEDILEAARFFHIEWLIKVCREFLVKRVSMENYYRVLELADQYFLGDLRKDIFNFVAYRFGEVAAKPMFMELSHEVLYELLADDHYIDAPEGYIFKTVLRWLNHNHKERSDLRKDMLMLIRYPLLELSELEAIPEEVLEIPEVRDCVKNAIYYQENPSQQCLLNDPHAEVRGSREALVLYSAVDDANLVQFKIPGMQDFFSSKAATEFMQSVFEFASVAVLGNFLFVVGGYDRKTWCSSPAVYRYNPRNRLWAQLSSMKQPRVSFALCPSKKGLYAITGIEHIVMDGHDRELILHSAEFYNPQDNLWHFIPELPFGCFSSAACVVDEKLFVSGGISDDPEDTVPVKYLHMYHPDSEVWIPRASMITEHQGHGMMEHNQKLYVVGGYTAAEDTVSFIDCHKMEVYDIKTDQWTCLADSPAEFHHFHSSLAKINSTMYILGGKDSWRTLHSFDAEKEEFQEVEVCGHDVQKIVVLQLALPLDIMEGISVQNVLESDLSPSED